MVQEGVYSDSLLYSDEDDLQVNHVVAFPDNFVAARRSTQIVAWSR
jgi:hypothetical protein